MWIYLESFRRASNSDPIVINSWVAGALGSAWRAVDQYLALREHQLPGVRKKFWEEWGRTEYWDEDPNPVLVELDEDLMERHLVIALHNSGVKF